ncbi:MAG: 2-C-methyl-D-erythritol 2,4-cyclodiphosphate synthase, partial [Actinomycetota bacterium]
VMVHDAARPLLSSELVGRVLEALERGGADGVVCAIPLEDAIKEVSEQHGIARSAPREGLWRAQTPQAFRRDCLEDALARAEADGFVAADCSELATRAGHRVTVVEGDPWNLKVTRPEDLALCETILTVRAASVGDPGALARSGRVGIGFDVHGFDETRRLVLGGVEIEGATGLAGWSDADVASHAVADALLGAAGLGDLGAHFPEEALPRGSSSLEILAKVASMLAKAGLRVANVDCVVAIQAVPLARYRGRMEARIASALEIGPESVNVKATTTDRLGFVGRREGAAAMAVVLVVPAGP